MPKVHLHLEDQESEGACEIERWNGHQRLKRLMLLVAASSLNNDKNVKMAVLKSCSTLTEHRG